MFDPKPLTALHAFTDPATNGRTLNVVDGEVIYQPDTVADYVYYIQRGQVRLYTVNADGSTRLIDIMGAGQWFGAAALAGMQSYKMRVVAVSGAVLTQVRTEQLLAAMSHDPAQLVELNRQLALKLMMITDEASRLVFEDCNQRLIGALIRFSDSAASTRREDGVVLRITHEQLAQAVGVARETVSLALTQLRQQNLLQTGRNQLVFNPEVLRQFTANQMNGADDSDVSVEVESVA